MRIIGVDFSGAGSDNALGKTWLAQGWLDGNILTINSCYPISRACLTNKLAGLSGPAVAAMDFPFSVPVEFAKCWQKRPDIVAEGATMPDLWKAAARTKWGDFEKLATGFGKQRKKLGKQKWPVRECDQGIPEAKSPLQHKANPDMLPMTFAGMQMLNDLYPGSANKPVWIPPLPRPDQNPHTTLLEVMPGAVLRRLELPFVRYKDGKQSLDLRLQNRRRILDNLPERANPVKVCLSVPVKRCHKGCGVAGEKGKPTRLYDICLYHHDALDAVVAAIAAALWAIPETRKHFVKPQNPDDPTIQLEGSIYTPGGCYLHGCPGGMP